jgi:GT2 family glycosyltransferase
MNTLSLGVSIVLYRTPAAIVAPLVHALLEQGAASVYLVDNSGESFDAFQDWPPLERVQTMSPGRNLGYGAGNNLAIRDSTPRHKYHLICNPDITLGPGVLAALCAMMDLRPEVGLCMPRVVGTDGELHHLAKRSPVALDYLSRLFPPRSWSLRRRARLEMRDRSYEEEMEADCLSGCFMMFRSEILAKLGGFDERFFLYFEDFDLSRRAQRVATNLYFPQAQVVHVHAREHRRSLRVRMHFIMSAIRYFNKWGWL